MRRFMMIPGLLTIALAAVALAASASPAGAVTQSAREGGLDLHRPLPVADEQHCFKARGLDRLFSEEAKA
jgi:ABC-type nitrate/sulfonate/bicarbonate transport system substrate-binding protein